MDGDALPETSGAVPSPIEPGPNALWIAACRPRGMFRDENTVNEDERAGDEA